MAAATVRKNARQRSAVSAFLTEQDTFRSAQDLHAGMRQQGESIGLATVYRTLQMMVEDGEVDALRTEDGEQSFRRCNRTHHHHHLVCRVCGKTVEVQDRPVTRWARDIGLAHGSVEIEHQGRGLRDVHRVPRHATVNRSQHVSGGSR